MSVSQGSIPQDNPVSVLAPIGPIPSSTQNNLDKVVESIDTSPSIAEIVKPPKKLRSTVWTDGFIKEVVNNEVRAICSFCKKTFNGASDKGTTHLKNHLRSCLQRKRKSSDISQCLLGKSMSSGGKAPVLGTHKYEPEVERSLFVKMVAKHDFSFMMSQYPYFRAWISYIMPTYTFRTRNTVRSDLMLVYAEEKSRIYAEIVKLSSRVTLTTDGWKPKHQNRGYFCVTCHYIDDSWILHKRIISFHIVNYPHHGARLSEWMKNMILEWNIDKKMFSVVVDNASNNSGMLDGIKLWLNGKSALLQGGGMFHLRCLL